VEREDPDEAIYRELARLGVNVDALKEVNPTRKALEELLSGLLKLMGQKFYPEKEDRIKTVESHDHILAIYPDVYTKLEEAFEFLKDGLDRNEAIILLTDEMTRDDILKKMSRDWKVDAYLLEKKSDITVSTVKGWYFLRGFVDSKAIIEKWKVASELAERNGRAGLRVFGDASPWFANGFSREIVEYEAQLERKFDIPMTAICGYTVNDVGKLTPLQVKTLHERHKVPAWT
jgi:hypothetical protein